MTFTGIVRSFLLTLFVAAYSLVAQASLPMWSYDAGPDPDTKMGKELIDITAEIPNMPQLSRKVMGKQKFRPAFGPIPWRMLQKENAVKILFIGQDGTHIAEAAGRPATAGFGGRAQDLARYFGVNEGAAFINTYAFTIKGQYGSYQSPFVYRKSNGEYQARFSNFVDNQLWLMTHDLDSPVTKWRNNLIDWIIRNNKSSIKLVVNFGGAARDAIATFIREKGGRVGSRNEKIMNRIQIPQLKLQYAGGNNQFPAPITKRGKDAYAAVMGRKIDYKSEEDQKAVLDSFKNNLAAYLQKAVFTKGGLYKNGLLHPAQLGGFDLSKAVIDGAITRSLKGLELSDGTKIENDVLFVSLPHPSYLSRLSKKEASAQVGRNLKVLKPYVDRGWTIPADKGEVNNFAAGNPYRYSRADIGPEYYDFGTPGTRMVPVSTASRMSKNAHVIVFGTRERAKFNTSTIKNMTSAKPATKFSKKELFNARPRTKELRYTFDPGPAEDYAKIMKTSLDLKKIFKAKTGMKFKNDGIAAYNVKNHPEVADFGHYRGTFNKPSVLILADPDGYDDLITARALTGTRGQYLHGLMEDAGIGDDYLVIKTVPFGMDGATDEEWSTVLEHTREYREKLISKIIAEGELNMIITDGEYAKKEMNKILSDTVAPIINIQRSSEDKAAGIKEAGEMISKLEAFADVKASAQMANIPRSHLSFYSRIWEGTSGDRVTNSTRKYKGLAFAEVVPKWAYSQKFTSSENSINEESSEVLIMKLKKNRLPTPGESIQNFIKRLGIDPSLSEGDQREPSPAFDRAG